MTHGPLGWRLYAPGVRIQISKGDPKAELHAKVGFEVTIICNHDLNFQPKQRMRSREVSQKDSVGRTDTQGGQDNPASLEPDLDQQEPRPGNLDLDPRVRPFPLVPRFAPPPWTIWIIVS